MPYRLPVPVAITIAPAVISMTLNPIVSGPASPAIRMFVTARKMASRCNPGIATPNSFPFSARSMPTLRNHRERWAVR
jgi:hypothetical protein